MISSDRDFDTSTFVQRIFWELVPLPQAFSPRIRIKRLARMYAWYRTK
jgi:hypothetical protein